MSEEKPDFDKEIGRLDRQIRLMKLVLAVLVGLWLGAMLMTQSLLTRTTFEAEQFVLVDLERNEFGRFGIVEGGARLELQDAEGRVRTAVSVAESGDTSLRLLDEKGAARMAVEMSPTGEVRVVATDPSGGAVQLLPAPGTAP